jgi:hypothetical protein
MQLIPAYLSSCIHVFVIAGMSVSCIDHVKHWVFLKVSVGRAGWVRLHSNIIINPMLRLHQMAARCNAIDFLLPRAHTLENHKTINSKYHGDTAYMSFLIHLKHFRCC